MRRDTELRLIERAVGGDFQAFEEVIRTYQTPVYVTALRIVKNAAAAEDVAQETFLCAFQSLGSLKNRDAFAPWMRTIARNRALGWLREQKKTAPLEAAPLQRAKNEDPTAEREAELFSGDIGRIVASLPETSRLPLILCYLHDVPTATAARFLGIEAGTLRKRLHLAHAISAAHHKPLAIFSSVVSFPGRWDTRSARCSRNRSACAFSRREGDT